MGSWNQYARGRQFNNRAVTGEETSREFHPPIERRVLAPMVSDTKGMMDFLRKATYDLSRTPIASDQFGHEFEARYKRKG